MSADDGESGRSASGPATGDAAGVSTDLPPRDDVARREAFDDPDARGAVTISPDVLFELIELTLRDTEGLAGLARGRKKARQPVFPPVADTADAPRSGKTFERDGVRVRIDGDKIDADVWIAVRSGANVPLLGQAIQEKVGVVVERMLGMTATEVNVHVVDVQPGSDAPLEGE